MDFKISKLNKKFEKKIFEIQVRVYYEDTDSGGIIYHSKYLNFAERARTEFLRTKKLEQQKLLKRHGILFIVKSLEINYLNIAFLDDLLVIKTKISELTKAKAVFKQIILKKDLIIASLRVVVCCINKNRKICRMSDNIYDTLNS